MAANLAAMQFGWHEATQSWRDSRSGAELFTELDRLVSEKLSQPAKPRD